MRNLMAPLLVTGVTLVAGVSAQPVHAEPWTILIYETPAEIARRADGGETGKTYWQAYRDFGAAAGSAGVLKGGGVLHPKADAATVRLIDGKAVTSPAHDASLTLKLGGYFVIDVPDRASAIEWAAKVPAATTGQVEIRAGFAAPSM